MQVQTVSLLGLNRMTGSVGLALKKTLPSLKIVGYDPRIDKKIGKAALQTGVIDNLVSSQREAAKADVLFLGYPYEETEALLADIGDVVQPHAVVTDLGPIKRPVQNWADKYMVDGHFVCAMPVPHVDSFENLDQSVEAATPDLFRNSLLCLMPSASVDQAAVDTISDFGRVLGTDPYFIDMDEYDVYVQALEVLPVLLSGALLRGLQYQTGWEDLQKMAGLPFALGTKGTEKHASTAGLIDLSRTGITHWLNIVIGQLEEMRGWVEKVDRDTLGGLLEDIDSDRERWLYARRENDWSTVSQADVRENLMGTLLLGRFGRRSNDDSE